MKMNTLIRLSGTLALWLMAMTLCAQMQQGVVKTKGRMINGRLVPGKGLSGAVVSLKGRTSVLVNHTDGCFSFPATGQTFMIENVSKKGYLLVDVDVCRQPYRYSKTPIYLVMETPEQQLEDQLEAKERISTALRKQYQRSMAEKQRLRDEKRISQEEYDKEVQRLVSEQQNNSLFVAKLVNDFAKVDYDQLDEFNRQVHEFILNGEFSRADSMLQSKGDMGRRISDYQKNQYVLSREEGDLSQQKKTITQIDSLIKKQFADLAQDCLSRHQIYKMRYQNDSAAYYIELRANLDTVNVQFQREAGDFLSDYLGDYSGALKYYYRGLSHSKRLYGEKSEWSALFLNQIANVYYNQNKYAEALQNYRESMEVYMKNYSEHNEDVATLMCNIGTIYRTAYNDYAKALELYDKALQIRQDLFG